jgi:hypothetical protein
LNLEELVGVRVNWNEHPRLKKKFDLKLTLLTKTMKILRFLGMEILSRKTTRAGSLNKFHEIHTYKNTRELRTFKHPIARHFPEMF